MRLIIVFLIFSVAGVHAQDSLKVSVLSNVKGNVIQLRWAVNSAMAWKTTNRYGFIVERMTVTRDGKALAVPEKVILTPKPLKARPLNDWQALATDNQYAAVIAQALYGESFELTGDDAKGVSRFIAMAQELEQRYLVSLFAADLCYPGAVMAGWGLEDVTVKPGERYLYRVSSAAPQKTLAISMGLVYVGLADVVKLPKPQELTATFGDKTVMLTWNYGLLTRYYGAYHVEKSEDGKNFKRISSTPLSNMNSKDGKPLDRMYFMDTLSNNMAVTSYRILGVNSFGEEGPVSEIVSGKGITRLVYVPHIEKAIPNESGGVDIEWEFDTRGNSQIKNFELHRGDQANGPFVAVKKDISSGERKFVYDSLQESNYFVIAAIPHHGEPSLSFPVLVQPTDTIPPSVPKGLKGTVDSTGVVRLSWDKNKERDFLGYRIYRAQTRGEELVPITDIAIKENAFVDSVQISTLNNEVIYAVTSLDRRYNQSAQPTTIVLKKPEVVPPQSPLITNYIVNNKGITLEWVSGGEENLSMIQIVRTDKSTSQEIILAEVKDMKIASYRDSLAAPQMWYSYSIRSVSEGGLKSTSPAVTLQAPVRAIGSITLFSAKLNAKNKLVMLQWKHNLKNVKQFEIYKGEVGKSITLWKVLKGFEDKIEDRVITPGVHYEYIIRALLDSGKSGGSAKASTSKR
ncbi:fibronectin type III domain-containing protein [Pseudochryseolinea flava]|uniref:Fibronectin type III domain-containing protein n=1 Tax=Pseudochryseolinea flava TaxID=2059302 RepID=A0A364XUW6_9BACT|nr:hypothetical protein [Pseudochryseolinea flava]RAV97750.1 hypothetical protein DQQ10_27025 [Pseudochryseolinea flava]